MSLFWVILIAVASLLVGLIIGFIVLNWILCRIFGGWR